MWADYRRVLLLATPIVVANLSVPLVGLVDTAVIGRLPDPSQIGAVALGAVVFSFLYWGFGFLKMGSTGLVAQAAGAADGNLARALIARNLLLAAVFAAIVVVLQVPVGRLAVYLFSASVSVESGVLDYFDIRIWSAPAVFFQYVLVGSLIGLQRTGLALLMQLVLNLSNVVLSLYFVLELEWGIEGVALASLIADYLAMAVGLIVLPMALGNLSGRWDLLELKKLGAYRELVAINSNIFIRSICLILGMAWFANQGALLGDITLAANAVLLQFIHVVSFGLDGFAHAAESLVGAAVGARDRRQYWIAIKTSMVWAVVTAALFSICYWVFAAELIGMLTTIERVREAALTNTLWVAALPLLAVWSYLLDGYFIGSLRTAEMRNAMLISLAVYLSIGYMAVAQWGNQGLWFAMSLFYVARALTLAWPLTRRTFESVCQRQGIS